MLHLNDLRDGIVAALAAITRGGSSTTHLFDSLAKKLSSFPVGVGLAKGESRPAFLQNSDCEALVLVLLLSPRLSGIKNICSERWR